MLEIENSKQLLETVLAQKQARNASYTLRAFARDLGISHSFLSMVRGGTRSLSVGLIIQMSGMLNLTESQLTRILRSVGKRRVRQQSLRDSIKPNLQSIEFSLNGTIQRFLI